MSRAQSPDTDTHCALCVLQVNPLYLMIPATVTCSYAFMLPVATPPNAIAHEASGMTTPQMMKVA